MDDHNHVKPSGPESKGEEALHSSVQMHVH